MPSSSHRGVESSSSSLRANRNLNVELSTVVERSTDTRLKDGLLVESVFHIASELDESSDDYGFTKNHRRQRSPGRVSTQLSGAMHDRPRPRQPDCPRRPTRVPPPRAYQSDR